VGIFHRNRLVSPGDVREVIEASTNISVPSDRRLIRVTPRSYILDGQVEVKDPVGMHGFRLDADVHLVTASVTSIRNLVNCIRGIGIEVEDLVPGSIASSEAVLTEDEKEIGVLLADIGSGATDVAVFRGGNICHSAALPVGGYQVTRDLSIGLGVPYELAEEAKIKFGNVTPGYEDRESITLGENEHTVPYQELYNIIAARVEEIFRLIIAETSSYDQEIVAPAGLVLTGGTANLSGVELLGQEVTGFPVRVRMPHEIAGQADTLYDPAYAASVGLLLWGARYGGQWRSPEISHPTLGDVFRRFLKR
jgi:cell division protein FtsA